MKKLLILSVAAVALACGVAFAEDTSNAPAPDQGAAAAQPPPDVAPGDDAGNGPAGRMDWRHGMHKWWHRDGGPPADWRDGRGDGSEGMMMRPPFGPGGPRGDGVGGPPSKAAHFILERGPHGGRIDIKCADEDSTQVCADAVKSLMTDIVAAMRQGGMAGRNEPAPGGAAPPPAPPAPPAQ